MSQQIHNPHDKFFRRAMSDVRVAREFFMQHLPSVLQECIDLDTLIFHKESFIDEDLKASAADVVYSADINNQQGYLYILVEHQSSVDKWIAFRLLRYMLRILEHHQLQNPEADLPVVYPLLFYNGPTSYPGSAKTVLKYIFDGLEGRDAKAVVEIAKQHLSSKLEGDVMTFADQLRQEGFQQGVQQGLQQGVQQGIQQGIKQVQHLIAERLLAKGLSLETIAETTGLSIADIKKLQAHCMAG